MEICDKNYHFERFEEVGSFFKEVINILKQMNYSEFHSSEFKSYESKLRSLIEKRGD
jgi:V/A-type H+-transporting ATPase subunit A